MSDWAERMTVLMREQGAALNSPAPQLATMTGNNTLSIGQLTLDADDLVFSAHLLNNSDVPILKTGDTVTVLRMSDSRYWVMDKVGGGMIYNGLGQTTAGTMLDATQGTALDARIDEVEEAASAAGEAAGSAQSAAEAAQAAAAQKLDTSNVVNNLTTTASGYALDARQGKALNDKITSGVINNMRIIRIISTSYTTNEYGIFSVPNTFGASAVWLLNNTVNDAVGSSFGVLCVDGTDSNEIRIRFRTLSTGAAQGGYTFQTSLIFAYVTV